MLLARFSFLFLSCLWVCLARLKTPWAHLRWKGDFSKADEFNWTPELKSCLGYDQVSRATPKPEDDARAAPDPLPDTDTALTMAQHPSLRVRKTMQRKAHAGMLLAQNHTSFLQPSKTLTVAKLLIGNRRDDVRVTERVCRAAGGGEGRGGERSLLDLMGVCLHLLCFRPFPLSRFLDTINAVLLATSACGSLLPALVCMHNFR